MADLGEKGVVDAQSDIQASADDFKANTAHEAAEQGQVATDK